MATESGLQLLKDGRVGFQEECLRADAVEQREHQFSGWIIGRVACVVLAGEVAHVGTDLHRVDRGVVRVQQGFD